MSLKIDSGLFKFNFTDHHAILGVPLDADAKNIRKRYLKIARLLHPDTCSAENEADKQRASQMLSKLVNPAYEKFSQTDNRIEYNILLKEVAKRLLQESTVIELKNTMAKQLNETDDIERVYQTSVLQLAEKQYDSFDEVLQLISQISELNLVYLLRKGGKAVQTNNTTPTTKDSPPSLEQESVVDQYCRRAQALMAKNNFVQARVELQDALKLEPGNSRCHALMGVLYLKQNQTTMAKVHINKALQLDSQEPMALEGKKFLDELAQKASSQPPTPSAKPTQNKQSDKPGGGSLFGSLFGGKKK